MKKIVLFIFSPFFSYAQLSPEINNLYQQLSKSESYESKYIGFAADESNIYNIAQKIGTLASDNELEFIAFNGNAVAQSYVAKILFQRKSNRVLKIFNYF